MDSYYPILCNCGTQEDAAKLLKKFYVNGLGIKCVEEEPWVTFAESSECIMALHKIGLTKNFFVFTLDLNFIQSQLF